MAACPKFTPASHNLPWQPVGRDLASPISNHSRSTIIRTGTVPSWDGSSCVVTTSGCSLPTYVPARANGQLNWLTCGLGDSARLSECPQGLEPCTPLRGFFQRDGLSPPFQPAPFLPGSPWPSAPPRKRERPTFSRVCSRQPPTQTVLNPSHSLTHSAQDATCSGSLRSAYAARTFPRISCPRPVLCEVAKASAPFGPGPRRGPSQTLFLALPLYDSTSPGLWIYPEGLPSSTSCSNKYLRLPRIYH